MEKCLCIILLYFLLPISHSECNIDTPILTETGCQLKYCSKAEFDSGDCVIDNSIAKTQWLNNIISIDFFDKLRFGRFALNSKGDLIFECSAEATDTQDQNGIRVFYWLNQDGSFYFEDDTGRKVSTKNIVVKGYNDTIAQRYQSPIIFVRTNDIEEYLISISLWLGDTEYYDFKNNEVSFVSTIEFSNYNVYSTVSTLIEIGNGSTKEYLHTFIGQHKDDQSYQFFYLISH